MHRLLPVSTLAALAGGLALATSAQAGVQATISIEDCTVQRSGNAGGFTWAFCPVTSDSPRGDVSLRANYKVNLDTYIPVRDASYAPELGTVAFSGGGPEVQNLKFAFRRLSVAQVRRRLTVTLSHPRGAVLGTATAKAKG